MISEVNFISCTMIPAVPIATVLGKPDTRRDTGNRPPFNNRFELLRDRSRSLSASGRLPPPSPASKRRAEEEANLASKQAKVDRNALFISMGTVEAKIDNGRKTIEKLKVSLVADESCNGFMKEFLGGVIDTLDSLTASVESLASVVVDGVGKPAVATVTATPPLQGNKVSHNTGNNNLKTTPPPSRKRRSGKKSLCPLSRTPRNRSWFLVWIWDGSPP